MIYTEILYLDLNILYFRSKFRPAMFLILYPVVFATCVETSVLELILKANKSVSNLEFSIY